MEGEGEVEGEVEGEQKGGRGGGRGGNRGEGEGEADVEVRSGCGGGWNVPCSIQGTFHLTFPPSMPTQPFIEIVYIQ